MACTDVSEHCACTRLGKLETVGRCVFLFKSKTTFENAAISWLLLDKK